MNRLIAALLCAVLAPIAAVAQDEDKPDAAALLKQVVEFHGKAQTLQVRREADHKTTTLPPQEEGKDAPEPEVAEQKSVATFAFVRPNRCKIDIETTNAADPALSSREVTISDGKRALMQFDDEKTAVRAGRRFEDFWSGEGVYSSVSFFAHRYSQADLREMARQVEYVGKVQLGEVSAHHLKLGYGEEENNSREWQFWIQADGDPIILQSQALYKSPNYAVDEESGEVKETGGLVTQEELYRYSEFKFDEEIPDETFAFEAPEKKKPKSAPGGILGTIAGMLFGGPEAAEESEEPESATLELVGKEAPAIELKTFGGDPDFRLGEHRGKSVVVLGFFMSWEPLAEIEIPNLNQLAKDYGGKGVVVCAVSQHEDFRTLREFIAVNKVLDIPVAIDEEAEAGDAYGVAEYPTVVVIDKQGIVRAVHFGDGFGDTLRQQLDDLLAGKSIAAEKPANATETPADAAAEAPAEEKPANGETP